MADKLTDAELVERLKVIADSEDMTDAAFKLGIKPSALRTSIADAKARRLTPASVVSSEEDKLLSRVTLLTAEVARIKRDNDTAESIRRQIFELSERSPEPPEWIDKVGKPGTRGAPMTLWSDWHWGETVLEDQVGGVNKFNKEVAERRVKCLVDTTIDLAHNHMGRPNVKYPGVVICLGGDMMTGAINDELQETNWQPPRQSVNELTDALTGAIDHMAGKFGRAFVPCVVGNHGRDTLKPRSKGRVFTSHEWILYCNLERYFRRSKHVQFYIPSETDAHFRVFGHRFLLTTGAPRAAKGAGGIIGSLGPI